jgi:arylsulfatase A-like enzyme
MAVYAAMIDRMDQNTGRLIRQLEQEGYSKNTLIIFLSDNGASSAGNLACSKYSHPRFDPEAPAGTPKSFTGYGKD